MNLNTIGNLMEHQLALAQKFSSIESKNLSGMNHSIPADLSSYEGQAVIRLFLTYFAEEIWEAREEKGQARIVEYADALHFVVELCLRVAVVPDEEYVAPLPPNAYIGMILRGLRQKPWKQALVDSKVHLIRHYTQGLFWAFLKMVEDEGITEEKLLEAYFAKAKTNHQRISSGY